MKNISLAMDRIFRSLPSCLINNNANTSSSCTTFSCYRDNPVEPMVPKPRTTSNHEPRKGNGGLATWLMCGVATALQRCCMRIDTTGDSEEGECLPLSYNNDENRQVENITKVEIDIK